MALPSLALSGEVMSGSSSGPYLPSRQPPKPSPASPSHPPTHPPWPEPCQGSSLRGAAQCPGAGCGAWERGRDAPPLGAESWRLLRLRCARTYRGKCPPSPSALHPRKRDVWRTSLCLKTCHNAAFLFSFIEPLSLLFLKLNCICMSVPLLQHPPNSLAEPTPALAYSAIAPVQRFPNESLSESRFFLKHT